MSELLDLETRIKDLEKECRRLGDIEAIRGLRYKYWRCIRYGLWDDLLDCYANSAVSDFGYGVRLEGKKALEGFYRKRMASLYSLVAPQGHNPEIEILSDTQARGLWQLDNTMVEAKTSKAVRQGVTYDEEYFKENGVWRIASQKVTHVYRQAVTMEPV